MDESSGLFFFSGASNYLTPHLVHIEVRIGLAENFEVHRLSDTSASTFRHYSNSPTKSTRYRTVDVRVLDVAVHLVIFENGVDVAQICAQAADLPYEAVALGRHVSHVSKR